MIECDTERWVEENPGHTIEWARTMWSCECVKCGHAHIAQAARWSDVSEAYLVAVTCSCGNRAVGIDGTPESAERDGRVRLNGYCAR